MIIMMIITATLLFLKYFLGWKLYMTPKNKEFFNNVNNINTIKTPEIAPDPQYVLTLTVIVGLLIGIFCSLVNRGGFNSLYGWCYSLVLGVLYVIEISRRVELTEENLVLSKLFSKDNVIPLNEINGMYIFSFHKKFINKHSLTTKLVVSTLNGKTIFTISSLNKKAILNLMKNNFGITDYKIFVASNK